MRSWRTKRAERRSIPRSGRPTATRSSRMAPAEYMGRYMHEWWDYAIADELHQLANLTAQGNALGVLNRAARYFLGLTGTLLSGYADDLFNTLFRTDARRMIEDGYEWGPSGRERFTRDFGVIETIERITAEDNACSKKDQEDGHHQAQAGRLAVALRQVPDGPLRLHRAGGYLRRPAELSGGSCSGDDGRGLEECLPGLEERDHRLPDKTIGATAACSAPC